MDDDDYDVVVDTLQQKRDVLWKMTEANMHCKFLAMNIMDSIRLSQIDELDTAIAIWKKFKNERTN